MRLRRVLFCLKAGAFISQRVSLRREKGRSQEEGSLALTFGLLL